MRNAKPPTTVPASFKTPFAGHLPGYLAASEATALGRPDEHVYYELLMAQWRALLDSPESRDERLLHAFLERHPLLLPGSATVDGDSGHAAYPLGVITRPKLPGLSDREPDFMWCPGALSASTWRTRDCPVVEASRQANLKTMGRALPCCRKH